MSDVDFNGNRATGLAPTKLGKPKKMCATCQTLPGPPRTDGHQDGRSSVRRGFGFREKTPATTMRCGLFLLFSFLTSHGAHRSVDFEINIFTDLVYRAIAHQEMSGKGMRRRHIPIVALRTVGSMARLK